MDYAPLLIQIIVAAVVLAPVLWTVENVRRKNKAKLSDAILIAVLGVVISSVMALYCLVGWINTRTIIMIIVWLALIRLSSNVLG